LERGKLRARRLLEYFGQREMPIVVPAVVLVEWWNGSRTQAGILQSVDVVPTTEEVSMLAGLARASVKDSTAVDAVVMATAAMSGGIVCTSDIGDLSRLRDGYFRAVRLVQV
jgi:hypothetical protein